jgi:hypothetical protein
MDPGLGTGADQQGGMQQFGQQHPEPMGQPPMQQQGFQQAQPPPPDQNFMNSKSLEVISSKLDAVRASLEAINQRLENIEHIAQGEQQDRRKRYY